jgi:hypothetical protein
MARPEVRDSFVMRSRKPQLPELAAEDKCGCLGARVARELARRADERKRERESKQARTRSE